MTRAPGQAVVKVEDLHKSFGALEVLKGIDFEVDRGEVVCIIGPSGSGKSTLLRCVNLLEIPQRGRIYLEGHLIGFRETADGRLVKVYTGNEWTPDQVLEDLRKVAAS